MRQITGHGDTSAPTTAGFAGVIAGAIANYARIRVKHHFGHALALAIDINRHGHARIARTDAGLQQAQDLLFQSARLALGDYSRFFHAVDIGPRQHTSLRIDHGHIGRIESGHGEGDEVLDSLSLARTDPVAGNQGHGCSL